MTPPSDEELDEIRAAYDPLLDLRVLPDGSVAMLRRLITTTAVMLDVTRNGFDRRFCFQDGNLARAQFDGLQSADDDLVGWFARRPELPCDRDAKMSPGYIGGDPALTESWRPGYGPRPRERARRKSRAP